MNVELSALQSFIEEQRQWLQSVLDTLGWTKESLEQVRPLSILGYPRVNFDPFHMVFF